MKYRRLGKTNMNVSVIGIGTFQYGGEWSKTFTQQDVNAIFDRGRELGINLLDTAPGYGHHLAEKLSGEAIKNHRHDWIVATKFGRGFSLTEKFVRLQIWDVAGIRAQVDESLQALQTDYIDLYQFHSGSDEQFNNEELWEMLRGQVKAGKIRHLGISVENSDNIYQTKNSPRMGIESIQILYNRLERQAEKEVLPACEELDLGVLARVPLASGMLSGRYLPGTTFSPDDIRSRMFAKNLDEVLQQVADIKKTELPEGMDMAQWALAWCLKHPAVTATIPGFKDVRQLESAVSAAETAEDNHPRAVVV